MILAAILHLFVTTHELCHCDHPTIDQISIVTTDIYRTYKLKATQPDGTVIVLQAGADIELCQLKDGMCRVDLNVQGLYVGYSVGEHCIVMGAAPPYHLECGDRASMWTAVPETWIVIVKPTSGQPVATCTSEPKYPVIDFTCAATAAGCIAGLPIAFTAHPSVFTPWQPQGCETWTWCWSAEEPCDAPVVGTASGSTVTHTYKYGGSYAPRVSVKSDRGEVKDAIGPTVTVSGAANPMTSSERAVRAQAKQKVERQ